MGYRRFTDREGEAWEVRDISSSEWELVPVSGGRPSLRVRAPTYEADPFELSGEELQGMLDAESGGSAPRQQSPFLD